MVTLYSDVQRQEGMFDQDIVESALCNFQELPFGTMKNIFPFMILAETSNIFTFVFMCQNLFQVIMCTALKANVFKLF